MSSAIVVPATTDAAAAAVQPEPRAGGLRLMGPPESGSRVGVPGVEDSEPLVLVIESEESGLRWLGDNLLAEGYDVLASTSFDAGLLARRPSVAVIDTRGPDGLRFLETVRAQDGVHGDPALPVIALGNGSRDVDAVRAFERGADRFLSRPFPVLELTWNVRATLRALDRGRPRKTRVGPLVIDPVRRIVLLRTDPVPVGQKEFALLERLASDPTRVWTKAELLGDLWGPRGPSLVGSTRTLDSHACRLRKKLNRHGDHYVINVWGTGYRLIDTARYERPAPC